MNEIDQAFDWQAMAYDDGASPFNYVSPLIENLHGDPRHSAEATSAFCRSVSRADRHPAG